MNDITIQHSLFVEFTPNCSQDEAASRHHVGHVSAGRAGNRRAHHVRRGDQERAGKVGRAIIIPYELDHFYEGRKEKLLNLIP